MSKRIEKLTPAQEAAMPKYVEKWTKIGLSTEPTNKERARSNVDAYYTVANSIRSKKEQLEPPKVVLFCASPRASQIVANLLGNNDYVDYVISTDDPIKYTVDALKALVNFENKEQEERFFHMTATTAVSGARELAAALKLQPLKKPTKPKLSISWQAICGGNLWAGWQAFYDYFKTEVGISGLEIIEPTLALSQDVGWIIPYSNLCILTEKPNQLHLNAAGQPHGDGRPSIAWNDGYEIYTLNGTQVPRYMAMEDASNLDPKKVLSEKNVEVRMQGVKKIGPAKLIQTLGAKVVDSKFYEAGGEYKLLNVNWTGAERMYLSMINPSTGETCIEPVHPDCKTVDQALGFRMQALIGDGWSKSEYTYTVPKIYT